MVVEFINANNVVQEFSRTNSSVNSLASYGVKYGCNVMDGISTFDEEGRRISSQLDFAEIFLFLQSLGSLMNLPKINLTDLENFFRKGNLVC